MTLPVPDLDGRLSDLVLAATAARRYFMDDRSKVQIADELGVSRFKVARLLTLARNTGIVQITVTDPGGVDTALGDRLRRHLGVPRAVVLTVPDDDEPRARAALARFATRLLEETVTAEDVVGLAWSRTVIAAAGAVRRLPGCDVVQLSGGLNHPDVPTNLVETVSRLARVSHGRAYAFFAPLFVPDQASVRLVARQPEPAAAFRRYADVTVAMVGIGSPTNSNLYDAMTPEERAALRARGVVGDVSGVFLDARARPVERPLTRQIVGVSAEQLLAVPQVIGVAYGADKAQAATVAVRSGIVTTLLTTTSVAQDILRDA